jgi:hypothetical protein
VVTGLNSTVSEIHDIPKKDKNYQRLIASKEYGHFGRVGEAQLWWFKASDQRQLEFPPSDN